jgi:hypothetical protein
MGRELSVRHVAPHLDVVVAEPAVRDVVDECPVGVLDNRCAQVGNKSRDQQFAVLDALALRGQAAHQRHSPAVFELCEHRFEQPFG